MNIKNPMTRELFLAGERFLFWDDSVTGACYFEKCDEQLSNTCGSINSFASKKYLGNVKYIDKSGFTVYGRHLGKWFEFRVKFNTLIHFPSVKKETPVEEGEA